jgi:hypothetical protein
VSARGGGLVFVFFCSIGWANGGWPASIDDSDIAHSILPLPTVTQHSKSLEFEMCVSLFL